MIKLKLLTIFHKILFFFQNNPLGFPILLLLVALGTYSVFIFSLGFFWDDWPPIFLSHLKDKAIIWEYWSYDRPFQSWTYYLLFPICQDSTIAWQFSGVFFRWTSGLIFYLTFMRLFPEQKPILQWGTILYIVFPGFSNQYSSVAFGSHFITCTVFGLSLYTMILSFKMKRYFWLFFPLSIFLQGIHLFTMEYFVGLEVLRPILLWILFRSKEKKFFKRVTNVLLYWLPYMLILGGYLYWRIRIFPQLIPIEHSKNYPYLFQELLSNPFTALTNFFQQIYHDLKFVFISMWTERLLPVDFEFKRPILWFSLIFSITLTLLIRKLLFSPKENVDFKISKDRINVNLIIAFVFFFFGSLPIWSTFHEISASKWSDRFILSSMFGISLLFSTCLFAFARNSRVSTTILTVITCLSINYQIWLGNDFRNDFENQAEFYTQLKWRIPGLEDGAAIYSPGIPTAKEADYSYSMGIELLYSGDRLSTDFKHWFTGPRYFKPDVILSDPTLKIENELRSYKFDGIASKMVAVYYPQSGCLWVIDPYYSLMPIEIVDFPLYGQITNQNIILDSEEKINGLSKIIDFSPRESWCFYFQKGDLAQSKGQYEKAVFLYEEAINKGLTPMEGIEYLPFIKAYTNLGRIEDAVALTEKTFNKSYFTKPVLCQYWSDRLEDNPLVFTSDIETVYNEDNCPAFFEKP